MCLLQVRVTTVGVKTVTSVGHAAVDQLVHQIMAALGGGSLMVVEVGRDVI